MASPANLQSLPEALARIHLPPSTFCFPSHHSFTLPSPLRFDPQPDWTLSDLKNELDALAATLNDVPTLPQDHYPPPASSVSWRELYAVADFGRARKPFRISAFEDDSDSDDDSRTRLVPQPVENSDDTRTFEGDETAPTGKRSSISGASGTGFWQTGQWLLPRPEIAEGSLFELERERLLRVQEEVRERRSSLETAIEEESNKSAAMIEQVDKEEELKHDSARRSDKKYQRSIAEKRDLHLSALQRDHEQRYQVEERKIRREAAAEEARKRENAAREQKERQDKLRIEAEAKKKADFLAAEVERRRQAEAAAVAALQRAEADRLAKLQEEPSRKEFSSRAEKVANSGLLSNEHSAAHIEEPKPKVSESAAKLEQARSQKMIALLELSQNLQTNPLLKKELKNFERSIIKVLQQISATQEQVRIKSLELMKLLTNPSLNQAVSLTTFASKLMSQCEIQVLKLPSYAFPLAQVVVNICSQIPDLMDVVLAKLHEVCIFTVPKFYVFNKSQFVNERAYFKTLGYKEEQGKLESTDDYVARMNAYIVFYAAITQIVYVAGRSTRWSQYTWIERGLGMVCTIAQYSACTSINCFCT